MSDAAPAHDERIHDGPVTVPRLAATVLVLDDGPDGLEVLLVRRTPRARFMAGAWVFPGGAVDPGDGDGPAGLRAAARRELLEEAGIALPASAELIVFSNWITPERVQTRYDTWFFLARRPEGMETRVDGHEIVDACWLTPGGALEAATRGELEIVFPTRKQLERLVGFASVAPLLAHARETPVLPVAPRVIGSGEQARVVLPGDPDYEP